MLCSVTNNQPHIAYQSFYLSISAQHLLVLESSNFVHRIKTTKCITENKPKVLRFFWHFFLFFFFLSLTPIYIMYMEIFVKDLSLTT